MIKRLFGATGVQVPVIGQGTWRMGESRSSQKQEIASLRLGIELGLTHIDTAEMYADGGAERIVAQAIKGVPRESLFLVTKVLPSNASATGTVKACEQSLKRLETDHVDVFLVHWWSSHHPIADTMRAMQTLVTRGLTRFVGVSNFSVAQMREAQTALGATRLACNQVLYHLRDRGIESELLPHCGRERVAVVGYTPLNRGGFLRDAVAEIAKRHGRTTRQVTLNFLTRRAPLFTIPKASQPDHVRENAAALDFKLTPDELRAIDEAF
ncbi:MAG: oxidoreductase [Candidatus Rokuibacteriota bacterium]|nr:MAG: oxidoreductase [Candidatus Rokubacteria bacterium]PYN51449.1 MAG: oxidoreductase [Candidatus Rokubacteria bacterium]